VYEWGESVVSVEESEGRMEDVKIMKSSKGGMKVKGGDITIIKGEFENNNPKFKECPSFRRNMRCEGRGKIEIESLKGGDGHQNGTSLFILSSDDCMFIERKAKTESSHPSQKQNKRRKDDGGLCDGTSSLSSSFS
jgi:hypothetical protein